MKCRQHVLQCGKEWWGIVRQMVEVNLLSVGSKTRCTAQEKWKLPKELHFGATKPLQ